MFATAVRLTALLGADIDREYCTKLYDTYPKTSEPELLAGYTKVPRVSGVDVRYADCEPATL